jgi:ricin-type beta-trefoil lectin protein
MHHRFKKLAGTLAAAALAAGLTMAGTGTARADVVPPASTWAEIFAPEINSSGITLCADNFGSNAQFQNLQLWRCHGYASNGTPQRWQFTATGRLFGTTEYQIANVGSGLCIGLDPNRVNAGTIAGSNLLQESCSDSSLKTLWLLVPATDSPDPNNQFMLVNLLGVLGGQRYAMEANTFLDQNGNRLIAEPVSPFNSAQWFALG